MNGEAPAPKKRNWVTIVLGVLVLFTMLGVGCVVVTVSWFRQNLKVAEKTEDAVRLDFEAVRAKFPGQQPLIQMVDGRPHYAAERATRDAPVKTPTTLHVIAYNQDEGKVVTFSLPFWLLRLQSGPFRMSAYQQGWDDRGVSFDVKDIEKHGPGIIIDMSEGRQARVIVWAE